MVASDTVTLAWSPSSAAEARRLLGAALRRAHISEATISDAVLIISELVGNAVRHATPIWQNSLQVAWALESDGLRVEVTDGGGATLPILRTAKADDVGGRGLALVAALSLRWGVVQGPETSTVWSLLPAEPSHRLNRPRLGSSLDNDEASYQLAN